MEAERLDVQCPVCNQALESDIKSHLFDHSKAELVDELLAFLEAVDQGEADED